MSATVLLTCESSIGEHGVCPSQARVSARTVGDARLLAAEDFGWWHHDSLGDRCPDHAPRRRP